MRETRANGAGKEGRPLLERRPRAAGRDRALFDDRLHDPAVRALTVHQHDELVIPASVHAEILVGPYRSGAKAVAEVESFLADFSVRTEPVSVAIARAAARLRGRSKRLRLPDALVLATAAELRADEVLTGDASWARSGRRVTVLRDG